MKRLLADYYFDSTLRYEGHTLYYRPLEDEESALGGMLGAAVLCALLADTDEGDSRGIFLDSAGQRNDFFTRYEREVRRENGGLFTTEVEALRQGYIELHESDYLLRICRNERLLDLALGLVMDYMQRLVQEQVQAHIYEACPWHTPFAQWLFDAAHIEPWRQRLLAVEWSSAAEVYTLAEELQGDTAEQVDLPPRFYFEGESAEHLMESYFRWLWLQVEAQAAALPDAQAELAQLKPYVLEQETNYDFLLPELKRLTPEASNLFRRWMRQWTDFITRQLGERTPAAVRRRRAPDQELFLDTILPVPRENSYVAVRNYILERCHYDAAFEAYYHTHTLVHFCDQLSLMFEWDVNPNHLGKRLKNTKK